MVLFDLPWYLNATGFMYQSYLVQRVDSVLYIWTSGPRRDTAGAGMVLSGDSGYIITEKHLH